MNLGEGDSGIDGITRKGPNLYKVSTKTENPKLDQFFNSYEVVRSVSWREVVPVLTAEKRIPSTETDYKGFYLVGDFALPCMEMAVDTGLKVARQILRSVA